MICSILADNSGQTNIGTYSDIQTVKYSISEKPASKNGLKSYTYC